MTWDFMDCRVASLLAVTKPRFMAHVIKALGFKLSIAPIGQEQSGGL